MLLGTTGLPAGPRLPSMPSPSADDGQGVHSPLLTASQVRCTVCFPKTGRCRLSRGAAARDWGSSACATGAYPKYAPSTEGASQ